MLNSIFFVLWEYINLYNIMRKIAELIKFSEGGVTLDYVENNLSPFDRDEYWTTFTLLKREEIEASKPKSNMSFTDALDNN